MNGFDEINDFVEPYTKQKTSVYIEEETGIKMSLELQKYCNILQKKQMSTLNWI